MTTTTLQLATKSLRSALEARDGLRILVARFRGRGVVASRYDVWMPNLGPSEVLLRDFLGRRTDWRTYARRYEREIFAPAAVDRDNRTIKNHGQKFTLRLVRHLATREPVTLLCHCAEEETQCHRHLLERLLRSRKI